MKICRILIVATLLVPGLVGAGNTTKDIKTNEVTMTRAPEWLTQNRVEKITDRIQQKLEWSTRRINVIWYENPAEFMKAHSLGPAAMAVTVGQNGTATIHLGPRVNEANFDVTFGHELVHVIILQKYKGAIPKWFEEGLANHYANHEKVDYKWLSKQPFPADVYSLAHPMKGSIDGIIYRYKASQALAEMLDKKCNLENLIRLSVQRKMENYVETFCEIKDLNSAFQKWVTEKSRQKS